MAKLYPPLIEGVLPAFTSEMVTHELEVDGQEYITTSKRTYLTIDFEHNPSVNKEDTIGMQLYMLAAQDNSLIANEKLLWETSTLANSEVIPVIPDHSITFELTGYQYKLIVGNHYKIQIAYIDKNKQIGYYSTVGVVKYTTAPSVTLTCLGGTEFQSVIVQEQIDQEDDGLYLYYDITEKLYSVTFELYNDGGVISSSGEILHNTNNDIGKQQIDRYDFGIDLDSEAYCKVKYVTINQLTGEKEAAVEGNSLEIVELYTAEIDRDNGCVILNGVGYNYYRKELGAEQWIPIGTKDIDFTVEYGKRYEYSRIGLTTDTKVPARMVIDTTGPCFFEDAFLYDGQRQLRIRYNPQMNSFKDTILETKVDTIGGKYPYIYRNSMVRYKEFPIGGLISYTMDEDGYFMDGVSAAAGSRIGTPETSIEFQAQEFSTNLSDENVKRELEFKMAVLEWLNNGKPKLFRSPTEGNYLVRLMNVSLAPTKEVGRMLHSFTATAYEIDDHDLKTLKKYGIIGG